MTEPIQPTPDTLHVWNDDLEQSLEVANFLDALERIVTRLFGTTEQGVDNEEHPSEPLADEE